MEKQLGHHWKIKGTLMESIWDCWEIQRNLKNIIWETIGEPLGKHIKSEGDHWEPIGKPKEHLMESTWDYKEILKESEEN